MTKAIIIPARYESSRFPGKPLAKIAGKSMIEWVIKAACKSKLADKVIVATDDERIASTVREILLSFKLSRILLLVCLTSKDHKSGTDRVCEVVKNQADIKYIVNLQGDEPLMPAKYIDKVFETLMNENDVMVSLVTPINSQEELANPNIVKAFIDKEGYAANFSRSTAEHCLKHIGIYGYSRETLLRFNSLPQSPLEIKEQLEQLRALENKIKIKLETVPRSFPAVDRLDDIEKVEKLIALSMNQG